MHIKNIKYFLHLVFLLFVELLLRLRALRPPQRRLPPHLRERVRSDLARRKGARVAAPPRAGRLPRPRREAGSRRAEGPDDDGDHRDEDGALW